MQRALGRFGLVATSIAALCSACAADHTADLIDQDGLHDPVTLTLTPAETSGVLALVNDCAIDVDTLDIAASLDARAARGVIGHRNGSDALCGSSDDDPFDDLDELDAVPWVGDSALGKLLAYALDGGYIGGGAEVAVGYFDGVAFTAAEVDGVVAIANGASVETLDIDVGLDARAAAGIVTARPFDDQSPLINIAAIAAVPYVGAAALRHLKEYIPSFGGACVGLGGTFETVTFTDSESHDVIDLANHGTDTDLEAITGIGPTLTRRIGDARPFATVTELGAVSGIGASVLTHLRDEISRWCTSSAAHCGCSGALPLPALGGTFDGVTFTDAEGASALEILNTATRAQLRADGGFIQSLTDKIEQLRPWSDLRLFADTAQIGAATMARLRTYAIGGLWQGPGPMQSAITVGALMANPAGYVGTFVSFNNVLVEAPVRDPFASAAAVGDLRDAPGGATIQLRVYNCNPFEEQCYALPPLHPGDLAEIVHVRVELDYGVYWLRINDTTEYRVGGCWDDYTRDCGTDIGVCSIGSETCGNDTWSACTGLVDRLDNDPADGLDNDCDGLVDENALVLTDVDHLAGVWGKIGVAGSEALAVESDELVRIDVSVSDDPTILDRTAASGAGAGAQEIRSYGDVMLIADCRAGTHVFSMPAIDLVPSTTVPSHNDGNISGCISDAIFAGDLLITADWTFGVYIYDTSEPGWPEVAHAAARFPRNVHVIGQHLLVLTNTLDIYSLGTGELSSPVQHSLNGAYPRAMAVSDTGIVAITSSSGVHLFDASDPSATIGYPLWATVDAWEIAISGDQLFGVPLGSGRTLSVSDISNPATPRLIAETEVPNLTGIMQNSGLRDVTINGDIILVSGGTGLHTYRLDSP